MSAAYVVATFNVKPEHLDQGKSLILGFVEPSLAEKGCLFYDAYQSNEDPAEFVIVDAWATQEDLDGHANSEHVSQIVEQLSPLLAKPASVKTYRKIS
ncbi:antibiotic biosynthesis monooxygenase [Pseudomonas sp. USTB-Z]|uniref:putative quinol monooxygenase n=1 Tax=Pseudomonas TaxID=286 RepID=UPI0018ABBF83|nr:MULTISPECIES: putative quinol monooxygenase [Pseudomonas]MBF8789634.1 antibiotic biosynthesis monooxygenase [Pseudomonas asiatica]MBX6689208.1 antibiotic biosynthesis monooxygenase [Pseudomonas sp. USTB-Z]